MAHDAGKPTLFCCKRKRWALAFFCLLRLNGLGGPWVNGVGPLPVCVLRPPWSWCVLVVTNSPVVGMLAHTTQQSWSPDPCITAYLTNIFSIIIFYYHLIINLCPKLLNFQEHYCVAYAINDAMVRYITVKPGLSFSHFVFTSFAMWFSFNYLDIAFVVIHSKTRYILHYLWGNSTNLVAPLEKLPFMLVFYPFNGVRTRTGLVPNLQIIRNVQPRIKWLNS